MVALPVEDFKGFTKNHLDTDDFRTGRWFEKLLHASMRSYTEKITAEYFLEQYPGLPPDAVADLRIKIAKKYAAISGGTTSIAYTGIAFAAVTTFGGAIPAAVPAAVATIGADLCTISVLQLRLAYDISVLYGHRLNYENPEDLTDLIDLAFGVQAGNVFSKGVQKLAPEATTWLFKTSAVDSTLIWLKALPVVGKYLIQRNIIKMAVPVVSIGLGSGMNYYFTGKIGQRARAIFRKRVAIEEAVRTFPLESVQDTCLLLELLWMAIYADKDATRGEAWLLREFIFRLQSAGSLPCLDNFGRRVTFDQASIFKRLASAPPEEKAALLQAVYTAAAVDGYPGEKELEFAQKAASKAGVDFDDSVLRELAENLK